MVYHRVAYKDPFIFIFIIINNTPSGYFNFQNIIFADDSNLCQIV